MGKHRYQGTSQLLRIELYSYQANFIRYFFFFHKKMKISYLCLIVAIVIGLGTVTATPADDAKAVAADAKEFKGDELCKCEKLKGDELADCINLCQGREAADVKLVAADAEKFGMFGMDGDEFNKCHNYYKMMGLLPLREAADNVKAVAADDFKFFGLNREERAKCEKAMGLVREAADEERQMAVLRN